MIPIVRTGIAVLIGAGIGALSMQALRAQAKPPAFVIAEVKVKNQKEYMSEFLPARAKAIADAGGKYLVQAKGFVGQAPAGRVVIVQFENMDKLIAFTESKGFKESEAIGERYADIRILGVEGVAP
jgi:uncharacterized protein (DUF1330 family)